MRDVFIPNCCSCGGQNFDGKAVDIDADGALIVETLDGKRTTVYAGDVSIR